MAGITPTSTAREDAAYLAAMKARKKPKTRENQLDEYDHALNAVLEKYARPGDNVREVMLRFEAALNEQPDPAPAPDPMIRGRADEELADLRRRLEPSRVWPAEDGPIPRAAAQDKIPAPSHVSAVATPVATDSPAPPIATLALKHAQAQPSAPQAHSKRAPQAPRPTPPGVSRPTAPQADAVIGQNPLEPLKAPDYQETLVSPNLALANRILRLTSQEQNLYRLHLFNLRHAPVANPDGTTSTLFATSVEADGRTYMIPTVWGGSIHTPDAAVARAEQVGLSSFPSYSSPEEAEARYAKLHAFMERDIDGSRQNAGPDRPAVTTQDPSPPPGPWLKFRAPAGGSLPPAPGAPGPWLKFRKAG